MSSGSMGAAATVRMFDAAPIARRRRRSMALHDTETSMSLVKRCTPLLIAALLLSAQGCASTDSRESTGEYLDDSVITSKVKTAIFNEPSLKVLEINVETRKNVVQLSGSVDTSSQMFKAVELARGVGGVRSVRNDMKVR